MNLSPLAALNPGLLFYSELYRIRKEHGLPERAIFFIVFVVASGMLGKDVVASDVQHALGETNRVNTNKILTAMKKAGLLSKDEAGREGRANIRIVRLKKKGAVKEIAELLNC